jgi:hypothetical protein
MVNDELDMSYKNQKTKASSPNQSRTTKSTPPLSKRTASGIGCSGAANKNNYQIKTIILTPPNPLSEGEYGTPPLREPVPILREGRGSRLFKPTKTNHKTTASSPKKSLATELIPPLSKRVTSGICCSDAANKYNYQTKTLILTPPGPLSEGEFGIPSFRGEIWDSPSERGLGESLLKSAKSQYDY